MKRLEDDVYSFGFILLEALVGPSVSAKREAIVLNVMVCKKDVQITLYLPITKYNGMHILFAC